MSGLFAYNLRMIAAKIVSVSFLTGLLGLLVYGQSAEIIMKAPKKIQTPSKIKQIIKTRITETRTVDFDGDGRLDFLVFVRTIKNGEVEDADGAVGTEIWISSTFKIVRRTRRMNAAFDDRWFVNLDEDRIPEIVYALLYDDSSEYSIYKQDLKAGKDTLLFDFNPVLVDYSRRNKMFWGYAWDVTNIKARYYRGEIQILASTSYRFDDEEEPRDGFKLRPVVFFSGKTTQPESVLSQIQDSQWRSLASLTRAVR